MEQIALGPGPAKQSFERHRGKSTPGCIIGYDWTVSISEPCHYSVRLLDMQWLLSIKVPPALSGHLITIINAGNYYPVL